MLPFLTLEPNYFKIVQWHTNGRKKNQKVTFTMVENMTFYTEFKSHEYANAPFLSGV